MSGDTTVASRPAIPMLRLTLILGALTAFAPLTVDMYLPSFPTLAKVFSTSPGRVQATLSVFFLGLAAGQAIYGPMADRFGRRSPLLIGIAIYVLASIGAAFAPDIDSLILLRLIQALGGCAGMVISRAVVRDLFDERDSARVYSQLMLVMGVAPILAPLIGGYLLTFAGWRAIFLVLAGFGLLCHAASWWGLAETLPAERRRRDGLAGILVIFGRLITYRRFMSPTLAGAFVMGSMFAYITGSPFVLIELFGIAPQNYGLIFGLNAFGIIAASQINRAALARWSPRRILTLAVLGNAAAGLALLGAAGSGHLILLLIPLWIAVASVGFVTTNAVAIAMAASASSAGSASALIGVLQYGAGALGGALVAGLHDGTAYPMALVIAGLGLASAIAHLLGSAWLDRTSAR